MQHNTFLRLALATIFFFKKSMAEQNAYYYQQKDDDDGAASYTGGNDYIKYWTEYAILPQSCVHYGGKDVIVYSMYEKYYNHCADKAMGTYYLDVPTFMTAYINQMELNKEDMGDDYVVPDSTYVNCYPVETSSGAVYYVQLGCADNTSTELAVNVYTDNTCTTPDKSSTGSDDTNIDVSSLQAPFGTCTSCVHFVDKNEDDVDDGYFENRMKNAPLCSSAWEYKSKCGGSCKRMGKAVLKTDWNGSDKLLLSVLGAFSIIMLALIMRKRKAMAPKEALIEEAALNSVGMQQTHVLGIVGVLFFVTVLFGLAGVKSITWFLLLTTNIVLFAYLMKLTVTSGIGPDGMPLEDEDSSDDDSDDDEEDEGYKAPEMTEEKGDAEQGGLKNLPPIM